APRHDDAVERAAARHAFDRIDLVPDRDGDRSEALEPRLVHGVSVAADLEALEILGGADLAGGRGDAVGPAAVGEREAFHALRPEVGEESGSDGPLESAFHVTVAAEEVRG